MYMYVIFLKEISMIYRYLSNIHHQR